MASKGEALEGCGRAENHANVTGMSANRADKVFRSDRSDGRFLSTAGFYHQYLKQLRPRLAFDPAMSAAEMATWRNRVREKLLELMVFPELVDAPEPKRIWTQPREGYRLEKWEAYPEPHAVLPFYLLVPDGASAFSPAAGVLCFSGSAASKENLAGELESGETEFRTDRKWRDNRMAWHYAQRGFVAVAIDSPATHETASPLSDRNAVALNALWMGRPYEAVSVFHKVHVLHWLAQQPFVNTQKIAVSGHSLGAKPADILGVLYPDVVRAVVHSDFVVNWQERIVAMNLPDRLAYQVVPGIFQWFDYTDLEAALAPRPLLFTEGGRPNQIAKIRLAYERLGAGDRMQLYHYDKYADPAARQLDDTELPEGLTPEEYFAYAYVDAPAHRFRHDYAVPWLAQQLGI